MVSALLILLAATAISEPGAQAAVPHSIVVCRAADLPTVVLDHHDDHRMVRYFHLGQNEASFYLIDPDFDATWQPSGADRGWRVVARGTTRHAVGIREGVPASIELTARLGADDRVSYSYVVRAGDWQRIEADCLSPPAPPSHLPEQIR